LERDNFAAALAMGMPWSISPPDEEVVRTLVDLYVPGGIPAEAQAKLVAFVAQAKSTEARVRRVREAVHAILTMAEYQLA
jgi:hypothetical protein